MGELVPPSPTLREPHTLRLYTILLYFPFVQNHFFPAVFYKATPGPRRGQGEERGPRSGERPAARAPSHLRRGVGGKGGGPRRGARKGRGLASNPAASGASRLQFPTLAPVLQRLLPRRNNK